MKITRHNGRSGKNGVYNPKHNDREFNIENSDHINKEKAKENVYFDIYQGIRIGKNQTDGSDSKFLTFDEVEEKYYTERYLDFVNAQNLRNKKNRHTERNRSVKDILESKKTCPEETIYQLGKMEEHVSKEVLLEIATEFFNELERRYGEHVHIIDWALHVDESTPHIHERHVFDCPNQYGEIAPMQDKALEALRIELPYPDRKQGRNNNRKMTFDDQCRKLLFDICEAHKLDFDKEPVYGGRASLEKNDMIIQKQNKLLSENNEKIATTTQEYEKVATRLSDVNQLMDDMAETAYNTACDTIIDVVVENVKKDDIKILSEYKRWISSDERKAPVEKRNFVVKCIGTIEDMIRNSFSQIIRKIKSSILDIKVKEHSKEKIKESTEQTFRTLLEEARKEADAQNKKNFIVRHRDNVL